MPVLIQPRWLFPTDLAPVENGVVEITNGIITGLSRNPDPAAVQLPSSALLPGLVNAHTHLEFSDLTQPIPADGSFAEWIARVIQSRRSRQSPVHETRLQGLAEIARSGGVAIGEIATTDWSPAQVEPVGSPTVIYREVLGLNPAMADDRIEELRRHLDLATTDPACIRRGVSPHAPYSVHPDLFAEVVKLARERSTPVAMHLAESLEEIELLRSGTGPLVELFTSMGIWRSDAIPRGTRPLDYLQLLATLPSALVIHGNYLDPEELSFLSSHLSLTVVVCPQTHRWFRHAPHPLPQLLASGVRVAIGTDSRASSATLNLWDDVRILRRSFPEILPETLLAMATSNGADALGFQDAGRLRIGDRATFTEVVLPEGNASDPWKAVFDLRARTRIRDHSRGRDG